MKHLRLIAAILITALFMYLVWVDAQPSKRQSVLNVAIEVKK